MGRLTINGKIAQFSTKLEIDPEFWNLKYGRVAGKSREALKVNQQLDAIRARVDSCYLEILKKDNFVSVERLKNVFLGNDENGASLMKFVFQHNQSFKRMIDNGLRSAHTLSKFKATYRHLGSYIVSVYKKEDITFHEFDRDFVQNFDFYLRNDCKLDPNTVWLYMIGLIKITKIAIKRGLLQYNPFDEYQCSKVEKDRGYLLRKEVELLISYRSKRKNRELVRDMFLFSCFTGLSYIDMVRLDYTHIQEFFDGNTWIITRRKKTVTTSNVMLLDIPKLIIEKYQGITKNGRVFPMPDNDACNINLRKIFAEIDPLKDKYISFHVARHTFATLFLTEGVPLESLSKMMGHKNIATTQIYAKIINEKVGKDMEKVSDKLNGMKNDFNMSLIKK